MAERSDPAPPRLVAAVIRLSWLSLGLMALAAVLGWLSPYRGPWWFELVDHFRLHMALLAVIFAFFGATRGRWGLACVGFLVAVVQGASPLDGADTDRVADMATPEVRLMTWNVLGANTDLDAVVAALEAADAEVVAIVELRPPLARRLATLTRWPHQHLHPRPDNFGVGLLSKYPLNEVQVVTAPGRQGWPPSLEAQITIHGRPLTVIATHPPPPVNEDMADHRNMMLSDLANRASAAAHQEDHEAVILGDLNTTPWAAPVYPLDRAHFRAARLPWHYQATWPAALGPLGLPIDHIYMSGGLWPIASEVGPAAGSDHRSLQVTLKWLTSATLAEAAPTQ